MEDQNKVEITQVEKVEKVNIEEIDKLRKDIEKNVREIIKNTKFYKNLYQQIKEYIMFDVEFILNIQGPPGIGKSKTILQILDDLKKEIEFKKYYFSGRRYEFENDFNYDFENAVIIFDDCFFSKRVLNKLINLLNRKNRIIAISNNITGFSKNLIRTKDITIKLSFDDLQYIQNELSKIYNIKYNKILFNLRELVNYTVAILLNYDYVTTFDLIINNIKESKNIDDSIKNIIQSIKEYCTDDSIKEIVYNILIQSNKYSKSYIMKKITKSFINLFI